MNDSHQSSDPNQTLGNASGISATTLSLATLREQLRPALLSVFLLTFLAGVIFPMALFVLARTLFPRQADGSLISRDDVTIGSELIGQTSPAPATSTRDLRPPVPDTMRLLRAARISARPTQSSKTERRMTQKRPMLTSPSRAFAS